MCRDVCECRYVCHGLCVWVCGGGGVCVSRYVCVCFQGSGGRVSNSLELSCACSVKVLPPDLKNK